MLIGGAFDVVLGFWYIAGNSNNDVGGSAAVSSMMRSIVIVLLSSMSIGIPTSDLAPTAVSGLAFISGLRVGMSLHGINGSFHNGRDVVFYQILLPTMLRPLPFLS